MINFAVVEIAGKQYKIMPNSEILVNFLGEIKSLTCDKVLLLSKDGRLSVGNPYLKDTLDFEVLASMRTRKIRVATYKAKANTRKIRGSRPILSKIKLKAKA